MRPYEQLISKALNTTDMQRIRDTELVMRAYRSTLDNLSLREFNRLARTSDAEAQEMRMNGLRPI